MAEYIERDKVLEAILALPPKMEEQGYGWLGRMGVWQMIRDFQSADVAPVVHGHWIIRDRKRYLISCSNCNWINVHGKFDYCPICGATMDGEA